MDFWQEEASKIVEAALRNIFDQYSQPENRITHALMTAINEDRNLLGLFLRELVKVRAPGNIRNLSVLEQQYPGEEEPSEDELERRGIPDGWIFDEEGWCVFVESKVIATLGADQVNRHRRTAERRGFEKITGVAIAPRLPKSLPADTVLLEWRTVYAWLRRHSAHSAWAARAADYLEIAEAKLIDTGQFVEGTLTMFSGFPFGQDHPFTYLEGKRVLELALGELRTRRDLEKRLGSEIKARRPSSHHRPPRGRSLGFSLAFVVGGGRELHQVSSFDLGRRVASRRSYGDRAECREQS